MSALDFVLNCAALLLWLNWWSRGASLPRAPGIALVSTLRRAGPAQRDRWRSPVVLVVILFVRAILYWQIGSALRWVPRLSLVAFGVPFRSDSFIRMLLYSLLSFLVFAAAFYFCLLLISAVNRRVPNSDPWQGFIRMLLGPIDWVPSWLKFFLPFAAAFLFWIVAGPLMVSVGVHAPVVSFGHRAQEAALVGVGACVTWKWAIAVLLVLHVLTTYVYLGAMPLWQFVSITAKNILRPMAAVPLRVGRFDFAPIVVLGIVFAAAEVLERLLPNVYAKLPL